MKEMTRNAGSEYLILMCDKTYSRKIIHRKLNNQFTNQIRGKGVS